MEREWKRPKRKVQMWYMQEKDKEEVKLDRLTSSILDNFYKFGFGYLNMDAYKVRPNLNIIKTLVVDHKVNLKEFKSDDGLLLKSDDGLLSFRRIEETLEFPDPLIESPFNSHLYTLGLCKETVKTLVDFQLGGNWYQFPKLNQCYLYLDYTLNSLKDIPFCTSTYLAYERLRYLEEKNIDEEIQIAPGCYINIQKLYMYNKEQPEEQTPIRFYYLNDDLK